MLDIGCHDSPLGPLAIASRDGVLLGLAFDIPPEALGARLAARGDAIRAQVDPAIAGALRRYFSGELTAIDVLPAAPSGTPFQERVWSALRRIPAGTTWSYRQLADEIGARDAVRAVGAANGANPVALVVPCHRVIGSNGRLVGYGGGLHRKRWLLAHEGAHPASLLDWADS